MYNYFPQLIYIFTQNFSVLDYKQFYVNKN